jgi:hypothetical protein
VTAAAGIRALLGSCHRKAPWPVLTDGAACTTFRSTMSRNGTSCCAKRRFAMGSNRALALAAAARLSSSPLLMGNSPSPQPPLHSAPRCNRPKPTIAASTACQSPIRQCTVGCRRSAKERSQIFRQWDVRSKPINLCGQTRMSHCACYSQISTSRCRLK